MASGATTTTEKEPKAPETTTETTAAAPKPITVDGPDGKTHAFANQDEANAKLKELLALEPDAKSVKELRAALANAREASTNPANVEASTRYFVEVLHHSPADARQMAEERAAYERQKQARAAKGQRAPDDDTEEEVEDEGEEDRTKSKGKRGATTQPPPRGPVRVSDLDPEFQKQWGASLQVASNAAELIEENVSLTLQNALQNDKVVGPYWEGATPKQKQYLLDTARRATRVGKGNRLNQTALADGLTGARDAAVNVLGDVGRFRGGSAGSSGDLVTEDNNYHNDTGILDAIDLKDPFKSAQAVFKKAGVEADEGESSQAALEAIHRKQVQNERKRNRAM